MPLSIMPLELQHLEDAAALVGLRYRALRSQVPMLPPRYAERDTLLPMLQRVLAAGPAVAAFDGSRLAGFMAGFPAGNFRGEPAAMSPEWGNAAVLDDSPRIYRALYTRQAAEWIDIGRVVHLVGLLANDVQGLHEWHWLGFGMAAADAVRDLNAIAEADADVSIRRAGPGDTDAALALEVALVDHLSASPVYVASSDVSTREEIAALLANPAYAFWLALSGDRPVGYLLSGPASTDACTIIRDAGTTSLTGAYTLPAARGDGIATALLNRALVWARDTGYARCAVDFEPMNPEARRFWLRHFSPVCHFVERHIDRRYVPDRPEG